MNVLEQMFPGLRAAAYLVQSPRNHRYNCIAWAAGDDGNWWWPTNGPGDTPRFWPLGVSREETLTAFIAVFATLNYVACQSEVLETGFQKVALFVDPNGVPTHAARQVETGRWTSKLGKLEDIEHDLHALEGDIYGKVAALLKRPRN